MQAKSSLLLEYLELLAAQHSSQLASKKTEIRKLKSALSKKKVTTSTITSLLSTVLDCHKLIGFDSTFGIEQSLTVDTFALQINILYANLYERFKDQLGLTKPAKPFPCETGDEPYGLESSVEVIDDSVAGISHILNFLLQSTDNTTKAIAMDVIAKTMTDLVAIGYQLTINNNGTIDIQSNFDNIFKSLKVLKPVDIADYEKKTSIKLPLNNLQRYVATPQQNNSEAYTWTDGGIIRLPYFQSDDDLIPKVIDKLLYEAMHHKWNQNPCLALRKALDKLKPGSFSTSKEQLSKDLSAFETRLHTHFGEFSSEDSDSLEEAKFTTMTAAAKKQYTAEGKAILARMLPRPATFKTRMKNTTKPPSPNRKKNPVINHPDTLPRRDVNADLKKINDRLKAGLPLNEEFLNSLETRFSIAQYRGIHYVTTQWDADARRQHRDLVEVNTPQYSSSAFTAAGVTSYRDYMQKLQNSPEFAEQIQAKATELQVKLQALQHSPPVTYEGRAYLSPFHLLQFWYSSNYDQYSERVKRRLDVEDPIFFHYLFNEQRPFLSTADLPLHALWYAYGIKLYEGHEHERLRPRWRKDGKAERPYSGKIYLSLHPLSDFSLLSPSHVTSLFKHGLIPLDNLVAAERETSFLGYLPKDRVAYHYKAKYPSFKGCYKKIFESKYGIDSAMYKVLQDNFKLHAPHSDKRRKLIRLLGEYLCTYHEVRLIEKARALAAAKGEVLIYRNEDGLFSLNHPDTPSTRVNRLKPIIMAKRELYEAIGQLNRSNQVKSVAQDSFITKLNAHYQDLSVNQPSTLNHLSTKNAETFRFFGSKNKGAVPPTKGPVAYIPMATQDFNPKQNH